jgi:uncharacterized protein (DUF983 family)
MNIQITAKGKCPNCAHPISFLSAAFNGHKTIEKCRKCGLSIKKQRPRFVPIVITLTILLLIAPAMGIGGSALWLVLLICVVYVALDAKYFSIIEQAETEIFD